MAAYTMWGFFPVYFKVIAAVDPVEILAHRVVWSLPFGLLVLLLRGQIAQTMTALRDWAKVKWLAVAGAVIALNWGVYIWAVQAERIFEASLGYYINPLLYVLVGVVFLGETLNRLQLVAVALAAIGVGVLTVAGGVFPWVSLVLAGSFTVYGVIRKQVDIGAMPGLFIEIVVLFLPALAYLIWLANAGGMAFWQGDAGLDALILFAGPLTVLPLLCFAIAARKLPLSMLGFLQFIGPTLQFCCGLYYGEAFTTAHAICFVFIWSAVAVFMFALRKPRVAQIA
jgi:chloramphenicol-sensitive protein RarD